MRQAIAELNKQLPAWMDTAVVMLSNSKNGDTLWRPILQVLFGGDYPALDWLEKS